MSLSSVRNSRGRPAAQAGRYALSNWTQAVQIWLRRRWTRQALSSLDDRLLNDVGISREDARCKSGRIDGLKPAEWARVRMHEYF